MRAANNTLQSEMTASSRENTGVEPEMSNSQLVNLELGQGGQSQSEILGQSMPTTPNPSVQVSDESTGFITRSEMQSYLNSLRQ